MSKLDDYFSSTPELQEIWSNREIRRVPNSYTKCGDQTKSFVNMRCSCGKTHWVPADRVVNKYPDGGWLCPSCAIRIRSKSRFSDVRSSKQFPDWFLEELSDESRDLVLSGDYNSHDKLHFVCEKHGDYYQVMKDHIGMRTMERKHGCRKCGYDIVKYKNSIGLHSRDMRSMSELEIEKYVESLGYTVSHGVGVLDGFELDIYCEELGFGIEVDGYGHRELIPRAEFYNNECSKICKWFGYHKMKDSIAESKNIRVLHVTDDSWRADRVSVENRIRSFIDSSESCWIDLTDETYGDIRY